MLNDFLLNPATMICGTTPMPFDLPKNFKILSSIGVFPEAEWTLKQNLAAEYIKTSKPAKNDGGESPVKVGTPDKKQILVGTCNSYLFKGK